jgi:hypothetical protein
MIRSMCVVLLGLALNAPVLAADYGFSATSQYGGSGSFFSVTGDCVDVTNALIAALNASWYPDSWITGSDGATCGGVSSPAGGDGTFNAVAHAGVINLAQIHNGQWWNQLDWTTTTTIAPVVSLKATSDESLRMIFVALSVVVLGLGFIAGQQQI